MHGKFELLSLGKASGQSTALPSFCPLCAVFSCFRNPPNSYKDHRIFNVRTWSLVCVRVYTRGLGIPTTSQHNILTRENSHNFVLCSRRGSNLGSLDLELMLNQLSHPVLLATLNPLPLYVSDTLPKREYRVFFLEGRKTLPEWERLLESKFTWSNLIRSNSQSLISVSLISLGLKRYLSRVVVRVSLGFKSIVTFCEGKTSHPRRTVLDSKNQKICQTERD